MSDGAPIDISAVPTGQNAGQDAPQAIAKIVSSPVDLPLNKPIKGEVIASENGKISVQTEQGVVVLESDIPVEVGQKLNIKLQNIVLQANKTLVAELFNVLKPEKPVLQTPVQNAPIPVLVPDDTVRIHDAKPVEAFTDLQARVVSLPDILSDDAVQVLFKALLNLPTDKPLPPTLQEGLVKFQQLLTLLTQANLLPAQSLQSTASSKDMPPSLLANLQQILNPPASQPVASNPLLAQLPQNFIQLQTIMPGQGLSPNILVEIRQQLLTILQTAQMTVQQNMPAPETRLPQGAVPSAPSVYTMPAIGMVLGQQSLPQSAQPGAQPVPANLVFMATPQASQLVGLLTAPNAMPLQQPLLPGTVFIVAFEPQTQQVITLPLLPGDVAAGIIDKLPALNLALGDTWPALDALWEQVLSQQDTNPQMMASLRNIIPTPTPQHMPPAVMLFLALVKSGLVDNWIAPHHVQGLEKIDRAALLGQLANDMRAMQTAMDDTLPTDSWRPLPIPLQLGDQLMRLQFFYRHPDDEYSRSLSEEEQAEKKKRKTRFVLNVPKTGVGDIQIDGLVQEKDLEMILRTEQPLISAMEGEIRKRYQQVLETTGMSGGINFQSGVQHYVRV